MALPAIYYICHLPPETGGELVNLQSVATLNQHGVRAVALVNPNTRMNELPDNLSLSIEPMAPNRSFSRDDVVVIPEYYGDAFRHFSTLPCKRVIHTQGPFLTFRGFDSIEHMNATGLFAGISCSTFGKSLMQRMGSTLTWQVVTPFVHPLFHERDVVKKLQVAYMPNKRPKEAPVVYSIFRQMYPRFNHVAWVPIVNLSRHACADVMAESAVFASFSHLEGLGLPPLEAMSSGCLVCGFDGHGGKDYATPENGLWIKEGDHEGFVNSLAEVIEIAQSGNDESKRRIMAGKEMAKRYSQIRFEKELISAWKTILGNSWQDYLLSNINLV